MMMRQQSNNEVHDLNLSADAPFYSVLATLYLMPHSSWDRQEIIIVFILNPQYFGDLPQNTGHRDNNCASKKCMHLWHRMLGRFGFAFHVICRQPAQPPEYIFLHSTSTVRHVLHPGTHVCVVIWRARRIGGVSENAKHRLKTPFQ